jgi:hypothetical protein
LNFEPAKFHINFNADILILGRITISPYHISPEPGKAAVHVGFQLTPQCSDYLTDRRYVVVDTKTFYGRELIPLPTFPPPLPPPPLLPNTPLPPVISSESEPYWISGPSRKAYYAPYGAPLQLPPGWRVNRTTRKKDPRKTSIIY